MLNQFRAVANNYAAKLLLALLVLSFAVWGIGDMVMHRGGQAELARIGSESINATEFQRLLRREEENVRRSLGENYTPELLKSLNLPQLVLGREIQHRLLAQESRERGFVPSDNDVARRLKSDPMFLDSQRRFDKTRFQTVLRMNGMSEAAYIEKLRSEIGAGLLVDLITSVAEAPQSAIDTALAAKAQQRTALVYRLSSAGLPALPAATDEELEAYYQSHIADFSTPEYRRFSYVVLQPETLREKQFTTEELKAAYDERIGEFRHPERRSVEQLLFTDGETAKKAASQLRDGKKIADIAKQLGALNKDALSLGNIEREQVLEAAADQVFSMQPGSVSDPVQSPFGHHVFRVVSVQPAGVDAFEEVRPRLEKELASQHRETALSDFANSLQDTLAGGATLSEAAKELGLALKTLPPVTQEGLLENGKKAELPALDKFLATGFATEAQSESSLLPSKNGQYYLLRTEEILPAKARPLAEVRAQALAGLERQRKDEQLEEAASTLDAQFGDAGKREALVTQYRLRATTLSFGRSGAKLGDVALPGELVEQVFARSVGESTQAASFGAGERLIAVVQSVKDMPAAPATPEQREALARAIESSQQEELLSQFLQHLRAKYPVTVHEAALTQVSQDAAPR